MNWTDVRKMLKFAPNDVLIEIIKGLFKLSLHNKAFGFYPHATFSLTAKE